MKSSRKPPPIDEQEKLARIELLVSVFPSTHSDEELSLKKDEILQLTDNLSEAGKDALRQILHEKEISQLFAI